MLKNKSAEKLFIPFLGMIMLLTGMIACDGDYRELAKGNTRDVIVVMDTTQWESQTAEAIRTTFGKFILTVPNGEPNYDLTFMDIDSQSRLDMIKKQKNVIFAAPISDDTNVGKQIRSFLDDRIEEQVREGESFAFPLEDQWYKDQYALILTSTSDSALAEKIRNSERALLSNMLDKELKRWTYFVYENKEQTQFSDSMWANHGFKVRIQHDYLKNIDTANVMSFRRYLPDNDRWMWIWWKDNVTDMSFLDDEWINATRDSLNQLFIKGPRDSMYVSTYTQRPELRPVITKSFLHNDRLYGYETLGTWYMVNGAMAGPFVNFTYYDPDTDRLFMIEYSQFAPKVRNKLPFVRQFRAMGRTFESDSTWNANPMNS